MIRRAASAAGGTAAGRAAASGAVDAGTAAAALAVLLAAAGCGREAPPPPVAVADSAGVRVVHSHRPAWSEGEAWSVADSPAHRLADLPDGFRPDAVRRLADGRLAALEGSARRVAIGEAAGRSQPDGARPGAAIVEVPPRADGPAGRTELAALLAGDTLAVREAGGATVHLVGPEARLARTLRLEGPGPGRFAPRILGGFGDGTLVATPPFDRMVFPGGRVLRDTLPLLAFGRDGALLDTLGSVVSAERFFARVASEAGPVQGRVRRPYAREELATVGDTLLVTADNRALTWEARGRDGVLRIRAAGPFQHRAVRAEDIAAYREEAVARASEEYRALRRELLGEVPFPGRKPVLGDLLVGANGHVWAGLAAGPWTPPTTWRVFAPGGRWLGTVDTPSGLEVQQVGRDFVAGVRRDGDGTPEAVVHRLRKPSGDGRTPPRTGS